MSDYNVMIEVIYVFAIMSSICTYANSTRTYACVYVHACVYTCNKGHILEHMCMCARMYAAVAICSDYVRRAHTHAYNNIMQCMVYTQRGRENIIIVHI